MTLTLPAPATSDTIVTATTSDPSLALLSLDNTSAGITQLTTIIRAGQMNTQFYVYGLAASGQPQVKVSLTGGGTLTARVTLDPSGFYWSADSVAAGFQGPYFAPNFQSGPLDPVTMLPVAAQPLRPGVTGQLAITSSDPAVAVPSPSAVQVPFNGYVQVTVKSSGNASFTLKQPTGFSTPSALQQLAVSVAKPQLIVSSGTLGKNTQTPLGINGLVGTHALTVTSSDPSKVLLSTDPAKLGSGSLTTTKQVYLQALASSGTVTIKVSAPNSGSGSGVYTLVPTGLAISLDLNNNGNGQYSTTTQSMAVSVQINLEQPGGLAASARFIPGLSPLKATISSSNTGVAVISGSPITIPVDPTQQFARFPTATILQVAPGETKISISQPAGFASVGNDSLTLDVTTASLAGNSFTVAKDTLTGTNINFPQGVNPPSVNTPVMLTSFDASRVLLSPDAATPPSASIAVSIPAGSPAATFYVHALQDNGTVTIKASASGYGDGSSIVQLVPLGFAFVNFQPGPIRALIQSGPSQATVNAVAINANGGYPYVLRPGIPPIAVSVTSSDPKTVSVSPQQLTFSGSTINGNVTYTPLKPGTATLSLKVPAGYAIVPSQGQLSIQADNAKLSFNLNGAASLQIGRDLQTSITLSAEAAQPNLALSLTSSDPSALVVSLDATKPGQASIAASLGTSVYLQALAGSGSATLSLTAPG